MQLRIGVCGFTVLLDCSIHKYLDDILDRPRLDHKTVAIRMSSETRDALDELATIHNCFYGGKPNLARLLELIASGALILTPSPATSPD